MKQTLLSVLKDNPSVGEIVHDPPVMSDLKPHRLLSTERSSQLQSLLLINERVKPRNQLLNGQLLFSSPIV